MAKGRKKAGTSRRGSSRGRRLSRKVTSPPIPRELLRAVQSLFETVEQQVDAEYGTAEGEALEADALEQACRLVDQAYDAPTDAKSKRLAHQALAISPDCADAYVLLSQLAGRTDEEIECYRQAVAAGQRAIGPERFEEYLGHFWGVMETRPYMRARLSLAHALWNAPQREEAVEHYREMLRLNPNDNQGVRYPLLLALLDLHRDDEADDLWNQYADDASADWLYTKALRLFRQHGDCDASRDQLAAAQRSNADVPAYLLQDRPLPTERPELCEDGGETEAISYAGAAMGVWRATPGALSWLRQAAHVKVPKGRPRPTQHWKSRLTDLLALPQEPDQEWILDVLRLPRRDSGKRDQGDWIVMIADVTERAPRAYDSPDRKPGAKVLCELLCQALLRPEVGEPLRPGRVCFRSPQHARHCEELLSAIGVQCVVDEEGASLQSLLEFFEERELQRQMGAAPVGPADVARLTDLPQTLDEVWQADVRRVAAWVMDDGQPRLPWLMLVSSPTSDVILRMEMAIEQPMADPMCGHVVGAMFQPMVGEPQRPGEIQFCDAALRQAAERLLAGANVRCVLRDELDHLDFLQADLAKHLSGEDQPAMIDVPGVSLEQLASYFDAAAQYHRLSPWRTAPPDVPIKIACADFSPSTWYAVVIGQSGMTLGLAMYDDRQYVQDLIRGGVGDEAGARRMSGLATHFSEAHELSARDVLAAQRYGWPVDAPEAYPLGVHVDPGFAMRPPLAWELELLEASLRAVPMFLNQDQPSARFTVAAGQARRELTLAWEHV